MKAKEINETIKRLDNQDWDNMKKHMDKKCPEIALPTLKDFKELVNLWGNFQSYKEKKLN